MGGAALALVLTLGAALGAAQPWSLLHAVAVYYRRLAEAARAGPCLDGPLGASYDFVVVGAGTAGAAAATRLSEAAARWSVAVLEAGDVPGFPTDIPLLVTFVLAGVVGNYNWGDRAQPSPNYCLAMEAGRCMLSSGKALGGSTVVNYMMYTRGSPEDYDAWQAMGNPGWGYRDLLPYFLRLENMSIPELKDSPHHWTSGPVHVERVRYRSRLAPLFMQATQQRGIPVVDDHNGGSPLGVSYVQSTTYEGARVTAWSAYLRPACFRPNLTVATKTRVTRVIVDPKSRRAIGVEVLIGGRTRKVLARKEVILSAGNFKSAQLLMLSGVGPADHLREVGVPVVADLPVGSRTQDHVAFGGLTFLIDAPVSLLEKRLLFEPWHGVQYVEEGSGPLTVPGGAEALAFVRTSRADPGTTAPDVELVFSPASFNGETLGSLRRSFGVDGEYVRRLFRPVQGRDSFSIVPVLLRPRSHGRVRLASGDPLHRPLLYTNYYSHPTDVQAMVEAIKLAAAIGESKPFQRYNSTLYRAPYPGCESLPFGSGTYWECAARHLTINLQHHVGSCRMGPDNDSLAVVDPQLKVRGIRGLRVVDCSIIPEVPSAHTMVAAYMIGEKAADIIKAAWT